MASIKNFGLVGIGNDVQFGKGGARLVQDAGSTLQFKSADGLANAAAKAGELYALGLADAQAGGLRMAAIDEAGKLAVGGLKVSELATKAAVDAKDVELQGAINDLDSLTRDIAEAAGLTLSVVEGADVVSVAFTGEIATATSLREAIQQLEAKKLALTGGTMTGKLILAAAPTEALEAATKGYVDAAITGLSWENPVDSMVASLANVAGLEVGDRVYVASENKIYTIKTAGAFPADGEAIVEGAAFFNRTDDAAYTFNGTEMVQFSGGGSLVGGIGVDIVGNVINVDYGDGLKAGDGSPDAVKKLMLNLAATGSLAFETEGGAVKVLLDGDSLTSTATGLKVSDALLASINSATAAVQAELDKTQASLGLAANGDLVAFTGSTFLVGKAESAPDAGDAVAAPANYREAFLALDSALSAQKIYTDTEIAKLGSMSQQNSHAVAITGGSIAADSIALKGATTGSLVFVGTDGALMSDNAGVTYDANTDTLTVGRVKSAFVPAEATDLVNKAYVDAQLSNGVEHAARGLYINFANGVTAFPAFAGLVTRIKIKINTAGTSVRIGTAAADESLVAANLVDAAETGVYVIEAADFATKAGVLQLTSSGAEGIAIIEYVEAVAANAAV